MKKYRSMRVHPDFRKMMRVESAKLDMSMFKFSEFLGTKNKKVQKKEGFHDWFKV